MYQDLLTKIKKRDIMSRLAVALLAAVLIVYFYPHPESTHYNYEEGRPWNYSKLIAPFDIPIHPDSNTIRAARDSLTAKFVPVYRLSQLLGDTVVKNLPKSPGNNYRDRVARHLRKVYATGVVDAETKEKISSGKLPNIRILDKNILSEMSTSAFISPRDIYAMLDSTVSDPGLRHYISAANLPELLRPNITYDETESRRHFDYDYLTLTADRGVIQQGQTIIDKGALVSPQDYTNLMTYEAMLKDSVTKDSKSDWLMLLGQFIYVVMLLAILCIYVYIYCPTIYTGFKAFLFIICAITFFFLMAVALNAFIPSGIYIVPMTIVPILTLVFFDGRTALFVSTVTTMICAGITSFPLEFIFLQISAASAAVYSLKQLRQRSELLRTACFVAAAYLLAYIGLELLMNGTFEGFSIRMVIYLGVNSLLTSMAYVLMFVVERAFGFISVVTLVELADVNTPLLRRLSDECPGTFQHSMAVSNLASDAAKRIGANELLVRAGALYHDVGKLVNPAFFTENQHGVNPHDALTPAQSARIVINHVSDGLRLADKAGLPAIIKDFISEHHGKGMAKYFYITECKARPDETVDPAPFTYPGPMPRSRETTVLMMADAVEAASRSLKEHTPDAIRGLVNKIIDGQIADGLYDESAIEFKDVPVVKEAFVKRLMTIYHSRVTYPEATGIRPRSAISQ